MSMEKPGTPAEVLEHYGKKGMKWGVRHHPTSSEIKDARARTGSRQRAINAQIDKANLSSGKAQDREVKKLAQMNSAFLKNPDRATALLMTRGEKATLAVLAIGVPGMGTSAAAIVGGSRVLVRRSVEKDVARANAKK